MNTITKISSVLILCLLTVQAFAQCTIKSANFVCVGELIQFEAQSTSAISSLSWDFGDSKTGTQQSITHSYTSTGLMKVKLTINLVSGGTCTAEKDVMVHSIPEADFTIDPESKYCLSENKVCLFDSSTLGSTNGKITTRNILWGDGDKTTTSNPTFGSKICHTYLVPGNFTITIELVNEYGCKTKIDLKVSILQDFVTSFKHATIKKECEYQEVCFTNDSTKLPANLDYFYWDFDDGTTDNSSFQSVCHKYKSKGTYAAKLVIVLKNGCKKIIEKNVLVDFPELKFDVTTSAQIACFPNSFKIEQNIQYGKFYTWKWIDTNGRSDAFSQYRQGIFTPPCPGKYYIKLTLQEGNCTKEVIVDTVESIGVMAKPIARNAIQCSAEDTVFFCHESKTYKADSIEYFWDFKDQTAPKCTAVSKTGQNINNNCNYWIGEHAKHKYPPGICTEYVLLARDLKNGCIDSALGSVIMEKPIKDDFGFTAKRKCIGLAPEYRFRFRKPECVDSVWINTDSACNKDSFMFFVKDFYYQKVCDSTGWVTVGFIAKSGDEKVFRSCDPNDYYISQKNVCIDTFWFHRWFQLQKQPRAIMALNNDKCLPVTSTVEPLVKKQNDIHLASVDWGDGTDTSVFYSPSLDSVPSYSHTYRIAGIYDVKFRLETDSGCYDAITKKLTVGYFNDIIGDSVVCPNKKLKLEDTLHYWGDPKNYWRDGARPESFIWDLADGRGFVETSTPVYFEQSTPGDYLVRLASVDQKGCTDTAEKWIHVVDVKAGIKEVTKKIICDDIIQLFDSSNSSWPGDTSFAHFWEFGDSTTDSYLKDPYHFYRNFGSFKITHIVTTSRNCKDTAEYEIFIDGPIAHFDIVSDTVGCEPYTAEFKNNSLKATDYIWDFGDSSIYSTKSDTNVKHTYKKAGIYYITLTASDSIVNPDNNNQIYYCSGMFPDTSGTKVVRRIVVLPIPKVDFEIKGNVCVGEDLILENKSDPIYKDFRWIYQNIDTTTQDDIIRLQSKDSGKHSIQFFPTYIPQGPYQRNCYDSISKEVIIHQIESVFEFAKDSLCPEFTFTNKSKGSTIVNWNFGHTGSDENEANGDVVTHNYAPDKGDFEVCLQVTEPNGCVDTSCQTVTSDFSYSIVVPNVFTPNHDGYNDEYDIDIENEAIYDLKIFNRWGEKVYHSRRDFLPSEGLNWNGTDEKGKAYPEGVYFYILDYQFNCTEEVEKIQGTITLIRD